MAEQRRQQRYGDKHREEDAAFSEALYRADTGFEGTTADLVNSVKNKDSSAERTGLMDRIMGSMKDDEGLFQGGKEGRPMGRLRDALGAATRRDYDDPRGRNVEGNFLQRASKAFQGEPTTTADLNAARAARFASGEESPGGWEKYQFARNLDTGQDMSKRHPITSDEGVRGMGWQDMGYEESPFEDESQWSDIIGWSPGSDEQEKLKGMMYRGYVDKHGTGEGYEGAYNRALSQYKEGRGQRGDLASQEGMYLGRMTDAALEGQGMDVRDLVGRTQKIQDLGLGGEEFEKAIPYAIDRQQRQRDVFSDTPESQYSGYASGIRDHAFDKRIEDAGYE